MQSDHVMEKLNFDLLTPGSGDGGERGSRGVWYVSYLLYLCLQLRPCCCIRESFDVQHDHVPKKMNFDLLRGEGCCRQNICYHVATFMFPFNVICNMIMFRKSWILTFWPHPLSPSRGSGTGLRSNSRLILIYCNSVCMWNFCKK